MSTLYVSYEQTDSFSLQILIDGLEWCDYCDVLSAVWTLILTHTFTAEDPLVSK